MGIAVLSTSRGVMTGYQAWKSGIGGELLLKVW
jgi:small subunit ribosomal protein S8